MLVQDPPHFDGVTVALRVVGLFSLSLPQKKEKRFCSATRNCSRDARAAERGGNTGQMQLHSSLFAQHRYHGGEEAK